MLTMVTESEAEEYARFLAYDEERLAYLMPQLVQLDAERAALESKRESIVHHIERVKESAAFYRSALGTIRDNGTCVIRVPKDAFRDLSFTEAAKKYLRIAGAWQATNEIAEALKAGGYRSDSKHFTNTSRTGLDRARLKGEINLKDKKWGLPEWGLEIESELQVTPSPSS